MRPKSTPFGKYLPFRSDRLSPQAELGKMTEAAERQALIDDAKRVFFDRGGKIQHLPPPQYKQSRKAGGVSAMLGSRGRGDA